MEEIPWPNWRQLWYTKSNQSTFYNICSTYFWKQICLLPTVLIIMFLHMLLTLHLHFCNVFFIFIEGSTNVGLNSQKDNFVLSYVKTFASLSTTKIIFLNLSSNIFFLVFLQDNYITCLQEIFLTSRYYACYYLLLDLLVSYL